MITSIRPLEYPGAVQEQKTYTCTPEMLRMKAGSVTDIGDWEGFDPWAQWFRTDLSDRLKRKADLLEQEQQESKQRPHEWV